MKLLRVIPSVNPKAGGPVEGIKQVTPFVHQCGFHTEIACMDEPDAPWLDAWDLKIYTLGPGTTSYQYSKQFVPWLKQNACNYDAIIVHGIWQYHSYGTWLALKSLRKKGYKIPYFVYTHGMLDPWFKQAYPLKHLKKWLYWPWGDYRVLRDASAVLFTCEEEKVLARKSFWLYQCNEKVVSYGTSLPADNLDQQKRLFLERFPELQHKRLLLFLGRIHPKKGCDILIEAFAQVAQSDTSLHLVMGGPDQIGWQFSLEKQVRSLGIEGQITWTGMLLNDLKWGAIRAATFLVLPSHQENFGIVVAEALACSLPVLISNKVNIWREIEADGAGLVANDDLRGVTQLLEKGISLTQDEIEVMQKSAINCFTKRFSMETAAQSLIKVLTNRITKY